MWNEEDGLTYEFCDFFGRFVMLVDILIFYRYFAFRQWLLQITSSYPMNSSSWLIIFPILYRSSSLICPYTLLISPCILK